SPDQGPSSRSTTIVRGSSPRPKCSHTRSQGSSHASSIESVTCPAVQRYMAVDASSVAAAKSRVSGWYRFAVVVTMACTPSSSQGRSGSRRRFNQRVDVQNQRYPAIAQHTGPGDAWYVAIVHRQRLHDHVGFTQQAVDA